ncbi:MTH865 family protein [Streptomyces sp. NPDC102278]|uniref:MTH865 family protein n=1 Tax=Streptomyces sp. NPDC102278 TaxID=3366152 RepID=UPI0038046BDE
MPHNHRIAGLDPRPRPGYQELLDGLPQMEHLPLVPAGQLQELKVLLPHLAGLSFPIESAGQLVDELGGPGATINIHGIDMAPIRMIKFMPAYYFPIVSLENLIEKMAELVRLNRPSVDLPRELDRLREQMPELDYPVADRDSLREQLGNGTTYHVMGRDHHVGEAIEAVTDNMFPIESARDLERKLLFLMGRRPLIRPHAE